MKIKDMYDDLLDLADTIDEVEDEIWRQWAITDDPKLEKWFMSKGRYMTKMKDELTNYLTKVKEGRRYA